MKSRENLKSLYNRNGYEFVPAYFNCTPAITEKINKAAAGKSWAEFFQSPRQLCTANCPCLKLVPDEDIDWRKYYDCDFKPGTTFDAFGVAHEPGSAAAQHMTRMHHPGAKFDSIEQFAAYPWPVWDFENISHIKSMVDDAHQKDVFVLGPAECTVWEVSWYFRDMTVLMMDMITEDEKASWLLNHMTEISCKKVAAYAKAGVDMICMGDDIGMQDRIMMSVDMYRQWLMPHLAKVCRTIKEINPDCLIHYHSCGYVVPFIDSLMEAGVEILNPVQPECMSFAELHEQYGERLSFNGTIGTQTTMPFGTPDEVKEAVWRNLDIAGAKGGLQPCPTHVLEPEVPLENIVAYVHACRDYGKI